MQAPSSLGATLPQSLGYTFGSMLASTFIGMMIYGLTVHQTYRYFRMYHTDIPLLKATVIVLFLADTLHSVQCVHTSYYYLVLKHFEPIALLDGVWSIRLLIPTATFIVIIAQCFYARRVYLLGSGSIYTGVVILLILLMIGTIAFSIVATVETFIQRSLLNWQHYTWLTSAAFTFTLVTDVALTSTLITYLRNHRTGFRRTDSIINILIVYTINTGLLTSTLSLLSLVFAFAKRDNLIYAALSIPATKSYATSVLSILNSRKSLANLSDIDDEFGTFGMSALRRTQRGESDVERRGRSGGARSRSSHAPVIELDILKRSSVRNAKGTGHALPTYPEEYSMEAGSSLCIQKR